MNKFNLSNDIPGNKVRQTVARASLNKYIYIFKEEFSLKIHLLNSKCFQAGVSSSSSLDQEDLPTPTRNTVNEGEKTA